MTIQSGTATFAPALTEVDPIEVPSHEIHYNAPTIVSCKRLTEVYDFPMYDPETCINVRILVPDLRRMTYATIGEVVRDDWISRAAVELNIPVAIAKARRMQSEGRTLVTRERTTGSMLSPPYHSSYVKFEESIPMVPDPVLRDYLKEDLTYSEYRDFA